MKNLTGSITAVITPFNSDDSIDFQSFENIIQFQLASHTRGIVVAGTTGEGYALEPEELFDLVACAKSITGNQIPVIAGTGTLVTKKTIALSKTAQQAGADGLLVINPYYNKAGGAFLKQHYTDVAAAIDVPIILYNVPARTGYNMPVQLVVELAKTCPHITGIKEASGNLQQVADILAQAPAGFSVYSGDDTLAWDIMAMGGKGCISVAANLIPQAFAHLCHSALSGDLAAARQLHDTYFDLFNANFMETNPVPVKTALHYMGLCKNNFRAPFYPWAEATKMNAYFEVLNKTGVEAAHWSLQENTGSGTR